MREKDIRDHINAFFKNRLQTLLVPASMGIGLALGACTTSSLQSNPDGGRDSSALQPSSGGAGGIPGAGGMTYGTGGGFGGAGGGGGFVTLYGFAGYGSGGAGLGGMATDYGYGGFGSGGAGGGGSGGHQPSAGGAGGGLGGSIGTVYGMGGFKDGGASVPETGKGETGQNPDELVSEAGILDE